MEITNAWELNANTAKEVYGCHVNYEERFYLCPYCGEPIYEEDWSKESLENFLCPVCEDEDTESEQWEDMRSIDVMAINP